MKILAIGDTHGRVKWKDMVAKEGSDADKIIFIGDYFDSWGVSAPRQIVNFEEILEFKRSDPDRIVLLLGNHDFHYISDIEEAYSGYNEEYANEIGVVVEEAIEQGLIDVCWNWKHFLFSHAGITRTWLNNTGYQENTNVVEHVNKLLTDNPRMFKFTEGANHSRYGDDVTQSPIWVRPESLLKDRLENFTHVVGHTTQQEIKIGDEMILIDCIGNSSECLIIQTEKSNEEVWNVYGKKI